MKEILKYLRQLHSFTQEEVAQRIGLSRQSYIKYERGVLQPNGKVVARLAELYRVPEDFIYKNEVPLLHPLGHSQEPEGQVQHEAVVYHIDPKYGQCMVADSGSLPPTSPQTSTQTGGKEPRTYEGYFDGTAVRVLTDEVFPTGKRLKLVEISDGGEEEAEQRRRAWETIQQIIGERAPYHKSPDDDPFYKEELYEALEEKYGSHG